jgi:2-C-methyl-D-erythritol 4-phosphate cytidylyltransferase/2-C-methyl-D-erythritol 2,4-cyclodiphosphate synthase
MEITATNLVPVPFHVLIAAAGAGSRFGSDLPKQYQNINGKTILRHTIERFIHHKNLLSLHVIINPEHLSHYEEAVAGLDIGLPITGAEARSQSVYNGLQNIPNVKNEEIILIHDAARPLLDPGNIDDLLSEAARTGAGTLALKIPDTIRKSENDNNNDIAGRIIDRTDLWAIQTPQAFRYDLLKSSFDNTADISKFTDESSLVSDQGHKVSLVEGRRENIKITTRNDIEFVREFMEKKEQTEFITGSGFDVHAFESGGDKVVLCGVDIPHSRALKGHSDADVALHALTDAILSTICAGDIGDHFPPSDDKWKDARSDIFLNHATGLLASNNGKIRHIDITLICEEPKISPHKAKMIENLSKLCAINTNRISIKATTTEGLGFTGRSEGIAAQANVTVELPYLNDV